jgi:hypothetical protein
MSFPLAFQLHHGLLELNAGGDYKGVIQPGLIVVEARDWLQIKIVLFS